MAVKSCTGGRRTHQATPQGQCIPPGNHRHPMFLPFCRVRPNYLLQCYRYIELNPVRAGMVNHPGDYRCTKSLPASDLFRIASFSCCHG